MTGNRKQETNRIRGQKAVELKGTTHRHPVIPLPTLATDALGCEASIGVGGDEYLALYFHRVADIGLIVVILGGISHSLVFTIE